MKLSSSLGFAVIAGAFVAMNCQASQEKSHVIMDLTKGAEVESSTWHLAVAGKRYLCVKKGDPQVAPQIVDDPEVGKAIRIELDPTSGKGPDNGRDKINYTVVKAQDSKAPTFDGRTVYYRFALKLDPQEFETPTSGRDYVIAQWWQGAPFGPPLSLQILPSSDPSASPEIAFVIRNGETGANPSAKTIDLRPKGVPSLERGKWYKFEVATKFSYNGGGALRVWIDGKEVISWEGSIGYDPSASGPQLGYKSGSKMDRSPNSNLELYFGPYRDRMASKQVFYFADVSYGDEK
jgi:hypothetical protein